MQYNSHASLLGSKTYFLKWLYKYHFSYYYPSINICMSFPPQFIDGCWLLPTKLYVQDSIVLYLLPVVKLKNRFNIVYD